MSAIFEVEITEGLQTPDGKNVAPPALKLVLLALADHAGDDGEGAYPSMTRLENKTGLSRPTVSHALQALMHAGWIERIGVSNLGTTHYKIIHPSKWPSKPSLPVLVNPVYQGSKLGLLEVVNPVYLNHPFNHQLTPNETFNVAASAATPELQNREILQPEQTDITPDRQESAPTQTQDLPADWAIAGAGRPIKNERVAQILAGQQARQDNDFAPSWLPEEHRDRYRIFASMTGLRPVGRKEQNSWIGAFRQMASAGITADILRAALQKLQKDGMSIANPYSAYKTARSLCASQATTTWEVARDEKTGGLYL